MMTPVDDWKIVLIDDEKDIRDVMRITLSDAGYQVADAENGEAGIRLCDELHPQIVITDIRMPKMDGIQVLENLKASHPDIEVIVATAFGDMAVAIKALQLDASDFITKPINDDALHMALTRATQRFLSRKQLKEHAALLERENARTTQELIRTISFQRNLIDSSMDGILACDADETIVTFNGSMERITDFSKKEVLDKIRVSRLFLPEEKQKLETQFAGKSYGGINRLFLYETILLNKNGKRVPVQISASVISDREEIIGRVYFFRDLREVHKLEREMADQARVLHQDKMMSLGRLAASVVHEINNPLFGVLNYLQLMNRIIEQGTLTDAQIKKFQRYLDLIGKETSRCSQIISSLLTFSRKSPLSFEKISIDQLLSRCQILCQHKLELNNIKLVQSVDPNIPFVRGDFNQMQQCVFNLIFNAIDAMPDGGTIELVGRFDTIKEKVSIAVKDSGSGISNHDLAHIFEPFYTTKKEGLGLGLGLSTVYGIMERHEGNVRVESRPGEGAAFILEFPFIGTKSVRSAEV